MRLQKQFFTFSHYVPDAKIKDFNDGKSFCDLPVKNVEEAYEKIIEMSNNNDYTTGNLLDFAYFKGNYKLIAIDLSKQTNLRDRQQINFIGKASYIFVATMFFIIEKSEETTSSFSKILSQLYVNNGNTKNCKFIKWF